MKDKAQNLQQLISLSRTMLGKAREESWGDVFVLEAERSELIRLFFFRTGSAGICRGGCCLDSIDDGDRSRYYGIRSAKKT